MTAYPDRAFAIIQPWAWLIVNGWKDIENRTWWTSRRGPVLIHASKTLDGEVHQALLRGQHPVTMQPLPEEVRLAYTQAVMSQTVHRGGIVGQADIVDCVSTSRSPWFVGDYGFVIANAKPLPFMPAIGRLSFFPVEYVAPAE